MNMDYWTALILGLVGSLHCAGMCGPLALALPDAGVSTFRHFSGRLAYNLGRVVTYCLLGVVFGVVGKVLWLAGVQRWVSIALGVALLACLLASRKLALWQPMTGLVQQLKTKMGLLLRRRSFATLVLLGLLNGLLPCGLVYVAGAGATATGGVLSSLAYMATFGAGTVPMMLAISLSGKLVPFSIRLKLARLIPVSVFLLAMLLILRGLSLGIPYLSPDLAAGSCCSR
jgi:sulfite exporter TauE/SafE